MKKGVTRLALFESLAREKEGEDSDVDVVVDIDPERVFSLIDLADLHLYLCNVFGRETDVVIRGDLRPKFRDRIAADEVAVF